MSFVDFSDSEFERRRSAEEAPAAHELGSLRPDRPEARVLARPDPGILGPPDTGHVHHDRPRERMQLERRPAGRRPRRPAHDETLGPGPTTPKTPRHSSQTTDVSAYPASTIPWLALYYTPRTRTILLRELGGPGADGGTERGVLRREATAPAGCTKTCIVAEISIHQLCGS